jgi:hypothetical protein
MKKTDMLSPFFETNIVTRLLFIYFPRPIMQNRDDCRFPLSSQFCCTSEVYLLSLADQSLGFEMAIASKGEVHFWCTCRLFISPSWSERFLVHDLNPCASVQVCKCLYVISTCEHAGTLRRYLEHSSPIVRGINLNLFYTITPNAQAP